MKTLQKQLPQYLLYTFVFNLLLFAGAYIIIHSTPTDIELSDFAFLSILFSIIFLTVISIFFRGQTRNPESQTMHTLVSVSLKFLLELVLVLIWFIVLKKTGMSNVIMFFLLYLAFSLFLLVTILKTLKNKSL